MRATVQLQKSEHTGNFPAIFVFVEKSCATRRSFFLGNSLKTSLGNFSVQRHPSTKFRSVLYLTNLANKNEAYRSDNLSRIKKLFLVDVWQVKCAPFCIRGHKTFKSTLLLYFYSHWLLCYLFRLSKWPAPGLLCASIHYHHKAVDVSPLCLFFASTVHQPAHYCLWHVQPGRWPNREECQRGLKLTSCVCLASVATQRDEMYLRKRRSDYLVVQVLLHLLGFASVQRTVGRSQVTNGGTRSLFLSQAISRYTICETLLIHRLQFSLYWRW